MLTTLRIMRNDAVLRSEVPTNEYSMKKMLKVDPKKKFAIFNCETKKQMNELKAENFERLRQAVFAVDELSNN